MRRDRGKNVNCRDRCGDLYKRQANERSELRYLVPGRELILQRRDWKYLSLFPMEGRLTGVCIQGAFYPLENAVLTADYPLGVSNEFIADTAQLHCSGGCGLVVLTRDDA